MATETKVEIDYPSSDGEPMAESTIHVRVLMLLHQLLEEFFDGRDETFIATNLYWYYQEGDRNAKVAPDVMVVFDVPNCDRDSYRQWAEGGDRAEYRVRGFVGRNIRYGRIR